MLLVIMLVYPPGRKRANPIETQRPFTCVPSRTVADALLKGVEVQHKQPHALRRLPAPSWGCTHLCSCRGFSSAPHAPFSAETHRPAQLGLHPLPQSEQVRLSGPLQPGSGPFGGHRHLQAHVTLRRMQHRVTRTSDGCMATCMLLGGTANCHYTEMAYLVTAGLKGARQQDL